MLTTHIYYWTKAGEEMTAEITYIAVYILGLSGGIIFTIIVKGVEFGNFSLLEEREGTLRSELESPTKQHLVTRLSSNLKFGIFKK